MFEKVNPAHPDKVADRIAGAIVDLAYKAQDDPYLETREREEQFVKRIVTAVEASLDKMLPAYWSEHIPQTTPTTENKHQTEPAVVPEPDVDWDFLGG